MRESDKQDKEVLNTARLIGRTRKLHDLDVGHVLSGEVALERRVAFQSSLFRANRDFVCKQKGIFSTHENLK